MYDTNYVENFNKIKFYNGPPLPLNQTSVNILKQLCPSLVQEKIYNNTKEIRTCCSSNQVKLLKDNLEPLKSFTGNCPTCGVAISTFACNLVCHPKQKHFINEIIVAILLLTLIIFRLKILIIKLIFKMQRLILINLSLKKYTTLAKTLS